MNQTVWNVDDCFYRIAVQPIHVISIIVPCLPPAAATAAAAASRTA